MPIVERMDIDLEFIKAILKKGKLWIIGGCIAGIAISGTIAALLPNIFRAEITVEYRPPHEAGSSGASMSSNLGGILSLAGIGSSSADSPYVAAYILKSRSLTQKFIADKNLLPALYAKSWNPETRSWTVDKDKVPTLWTAYSKFDNEVRNIKVDADTHLITLAIDWTDPTLAANWANDYVKEADEHLRIETIKQSEYNLAYLNKQIESVTIPELRGSLASLIQSELKTNMAAKGSSFYAFKVVDSAIKPEKKYAPHRAVIILLGLFFGFLFGSIAALLQYNYSK